LKNAHNSKGDWLTHGLTYKEDRYSELDQINKETVGKLDLAWSINLGTKRGIEASPIVVDGIMYLTGPWSKVFAVDARKGSIIWEYDPEVPRKYGEWACCDVVNRGVALYKGAVFVGTIDGRLISIDAATGEENWEVVTVNKKQKYTITGAPRIANGKVIIGNGGAEYDARGYVTAYDAATGKQAWRFYTVPGDPSKPFENSGLEEAAKTWTGEWWKMGGGGTVWDAIVYDPELNFIYLGVGNGTPWDQKYRSPEGGDNLFLSSIVALNADDGTYQWHFQTTPGDTWDFTATQPIVLADLEIEGKPRKVLMQAPKNGFFYVIDRTNGEFISGKPYTYLNWATGLDEKGRPIEADFARYSDGKNYYISPGPYGGHNWQPMAFNRKTGLMYVPAHNASLAYRFNPDFQFNKVSGAGSGSGWNVSFADKLYMPTEFDEEGPNFLAPYGRLVAWDPVNQKEKWAVTHQSTHWNGGVLTTAGGLVFQGNAEGKFRAYDAENGDILWEKDLRSGIIAPPVTYMVDGKQYLTLAVGWGGSVGLNRKFTTHVHPGTIYTFEIDGKADYPAAIQAPMANLTQQVPEGTPTQIGHGFNNYVKFCIQCHGDQVGAGGGIVPDLSRSTDGVFSNYKEIVLEGALLANGMPSFEGRLSEQDIKNIADYVKYTSKSLQEGMDPMTLLTNLAKMQYLADTEVRKD
jgi:quinohemoprotein ethanol dehydrogenase